MNRNLLTDQLWFCPTQEESFYGILCFFYVKDYCLVSRLNLCRLDTLKLAVTRYNDLIDRKNLFFKKSYMNLTLKMLAITIAIGPMIFSKML